MTELEQLMRDEARKLLTGGSVEVIIGYEDGTLPLRTTPAFVRDPDEADRLVWNASCENNLATYLHHVTGKVGIVAKGCDARSIVSEIVERQIPRDDVVIIGVPCQGVLDRHAIEMRVDGREVLEAQVTDGHLIVRGEDFEESLDLQDVLFQSCVPCAHRNPPLYDILIGELIDVEEAGASDQSVQTLESWTADERWAYFSKEFSRCIRCYACREACPSCYCDECFVDQSQPSWFGNSNDLSDVIAFHLVRLYHTAGRCLDCGACGRACPVHIDLRTLRKLVEKEISERYGYEAGLELGEVPPLATFRTDDPQEFIR